MPSSPFAYHLAVTKKRDLGHLRKASMQPNVYLPLRLTQDTYIFAFVEKLTIIAVFIE